MSEATAQRSTFVSVVAWIFIIFSGLATLLGIAQNIMLHLFVPLDELRAHAAAHQMPDNVSPFLYFLSTHLDWFFGLFLLLSLLTLISAIGLLNRLNWARLAFMGMMIMGVLWNLGSLLVQQTIMGGMPPPTADAPADFMAQMNTMQTIMMILMYVFCLGFAALFGWIAWKLHTPAIVAEFKPVDST